MDWKFTTDLCGEPFWRPGPDDEDLTLGYSLLRALAESEYTLVEISPGVWRHSAEGVTYMPKEVDRG